MESTAINRIWIFVILPLFLITGAVWYVILSMPSQIYSASQTPASVLMKYNSDYAVAEGLRKEGKHGLALKSYQKSLDVAEDDFQRAQIALDIARETEQLGRYEEAIIQFKAIAADSSSYAVIRAAALTSVGLMYHTYSGSGSITLQKIITETFKDSPYSSFRNNGASLNMAYIKLFEHAASIYPFALSEALIAHGYSDELLGIQAATSTPQGKEYIARVVQGLEAAGADLVRMRSAGEERFLVPEVLVRAGSTVDNLATLGVISGPEQAEPYFGDGVQYATALGDKPGNSYALRYASFLANRYGDTRAQDIRNLLASFRLGNERSIHATSVDYLRSVRTEEVPSARIQQLVALGKIDSSFKGYLLSLGWQESDF